MPESWYVFQPEEKRFKPIDLSELPENPGYIFLSEEVYPSESYRGSDVILKLFSPFGEKLVRDGNQGMGDRKSNKEYNERMQHLVNLADFFTRGKEFRFLDSEELVPREILAGTLKPVREDRIDSSKKWEIRGDRGQLLSEVYFENGCYQKSEFTNHAAEYDV